MAQVDFYLLQQGEGPAAEQFCCRLIEKIFSQGHRILLRVSDPAQAQRLDDLLWSFRQQSFIPHAQINAQASPAEPVLIATPEACPSTGEVLVNLCATPLAEGIQFERMAEVISATEEDKVAARQRYRDYRNRGLELQTHDIHP